MKLVDAAMTPHKVLRAADRVKRRNLFRIGGIVRKIARQSIRRTKKSAKHGDPPRQHTNPGLKLIKFEVTDENNVYVYTQPFGITKGIDTPSVLEEGGYQKVRRIGKSRKRVHHPFLAPAEVKARTNYPHIWRDSF